VSACAADTEPAVGRTKSSGLCASSPADSCICAVTYARQQTDENKLLSQTGVDTQQLDKDRSAARSHPEGKQEAARSVNMPRSTPLRRQGVFEDSERLNKNKMNARQTDGHETNYHERALAVRDGNTSRTIIGRNGLFSVRRP